MKIIKWIIHVLGAVCIVTTSKEARIRAIQTWRTATPFITFEDSEVLVNMSNVTDIALDQGVIWVRF